MIVENSALQRDQWLSLLCYYVICKMKKTICPLPRLKFIVNSIKMCMYLRNRSELSLFFEKPNKRMSFFGSAFQSTLLTHVGEFFLYCVMHTFLSSQNASELSWGKVLLIRVVHREQIMRHVCSVALTYSYGLTAFLRFLTDMWCCENSKCGSKTRNLEQLWIWL